MPQYKTLIKTSKGVLHSDNVFLTRKRVGDESRSERKPERKVRVEIERPRIVRYWKCQP